MPNTAAIEIQILDFLVSSDSQSVSKKGENRF